MFKRRFMLRLAVALITFLIGWSAAALFGATRNDRFFAPHARARIVFVPFNAAPKDLELSPLPPCGSYRMRHAFERHERRDTDFDFDFDVPSLPPPPAAPTQPHSFDH
jgi:hypothetical protein